MLTQGTVLGTRYQIIRRIGGGGMGDVYLAYDQRLGNQVVVKENRGGDPQLFYSEARILSVLHHSHLPRVIDYFIEPNQAQYLVMDYVEGITLEQVVQQRGMLSEPDALTWMFQVLDAVRYLHTNRIIHRDIKPQNIIVTPDVRAMLVDFGIAKVIQPGRKTLSGAQGFGSPGYASPEHYTGGTDERSDVYALGATLYYALTGMEPPSVPERASGVSLISIRQRNPSATTKIANVITKAMELQVAQRLQNVPEMEQALRPSPTNRMMLGVGAIVIALLIVGVTMIAMFGGRVTPLVTPTLAAAVPPTLAPIAVTPTAVSSSIAPAFTSTVTRAPATQTPFVITATSIPPTNTRAPSATLTMTPSATAIAASQALVIADDFGDYSSNNELRAAYTINAAWGTNRASIGLGSINNLAVLQLDYSITGISSSDNYVILNHTFDPHQDWRGARAVEIWVRNDNKPTQLIMQFGEGASPDYVQFPFEVWRAVIDLAPNQSGTVRVPLNSFGQELGWAQSINNRMDLDRIGYFALGVRASAFGDGTLYLGSIRILP